MATCQTCNSGELESQRVYRLEGPAVTIGYVLLVPSILGILAAIAIGVGSWVASAGALSTEATKGVRAERYAEDFPPDVADALLSGEEISEERLLELTEEQRAQVQAERLAGAMMATGEAAGAGCLGVMGTMMSLVIGVFSPGWGSHGLALGDEKERSQVSSVRRGRRCILT